jgi:hypothetical protein
MGLDPKVKWDDDNVQYYCEQCRPEEHKELLEAMERGETPWIQKRGAPRWIQKHQGAAIRARASQGIPEPEDAEKLVPSNEGDIEAKEASNGAPTDTKVCRISYSLCVDSSNFHEPKLIFIMQDVSSKTKPTTKRKRKSETLPDVEHDEKRRKSVVNNLTVLPEERQKLVKSLSNAIAPLLRTEVKAGKQRIPETHTEAKHCELLAIEIDDALVKNRGDYVDKNSDYWNQFTAILFNIRKNHDLFVDFLNHKITADQLATMSTEEMASAERQKQDAAIREAVEKQHILVAEETIGPRIRKTHKGDEIIDDDAKHIAMDDTATSSSIPHRTASNDLQSPTTFSPIDRESTKTSVKTEGSTQRKPGRTPSETFDIGKVWSHVQQTDQDQRRQSEILRRQSAITQSTPTQGPGEDADIDRLLKEDDETYSPADYSSDPTVIWQGGLHMPAVADFRTVGRLVAGGDLSKKIPWTELISAEPEIRGRIDISRASEYMKSLRSSENTDIACLSLSPLDKKSQEGMIKICEYFSQRNRWGVVSEESRKHDAVRDVYVIPIRTGAMDLPAFLGDLENCSIETPPSEDMLLLTIIARIVAPVPASSPTKGSSVDAIPKPMQIDSRPPALAGFGASMATPQQPLFSPTSPMSNTPFHQAQVTPSPHQLAARILGPHYGCPTAQAILTQGSPNEEHLLNLRIILDKVPDAQQDLSRLMQELEKQASQ